MYTYRLALAHSTLHIIIQERTSTQGAHSQRVSVTAGVAKEQDLQIKTKSAVTAIQSYECGQRSLAASVRLASHTQHQSVEL